MLSEKKLGLSLAVCTVLLSQAAVAHDKHAEDIGEVNVEEESEEQQLLRSSLPVSVIDAKQFHGRNISLNEVLKRVAGVRLAQEGGLGSRSTIAIHGLEGQRVKIFLDGSPLNAPDGTFGINDIPVQLIERIEIYKGVVPARFGGDALGGAVNVVARDFEGSWLDTNLSLGSYDTQRFSGVFTKKWEELGLQVGAGGFYNHAANDYLMKSPYVDGLKIRRDHDEFESLLLVTAGKIEDVWFDKFSWDVAYYESMKEIQGIEFNIREAKNESNAKVLGGEVEKTDMFVEGLDFEYSIVGVDLTLSLIDKATTCYDFSGSERACPGIGGEVGGIPHDSDDEQIELRQDLNLHYAINSQHGLNLHWNYLNSEYTPNDPIASEALGYNVGKFPSEKTNTVTSLSWESAFLDGKSANDIGYKLYDYDYTITSEKRGLAGTPQQTRSKGSESGFYVSTRYTVLPDLFLKASYEEAYRLPDNSEAFGDGATITSSPDLKPEQGKNWNLGILFDRYDIWGMPWLKFEATYFHRDLEDMIKLVSVNRSSQYVNLGQIEVEGFEVELKADLTDRLFVFANYTNQELINKQRYLDDNIATPNPAYGKDVPNVPKQIANIGIEHKTLGLFRGDALFKVFWETNWVDDYYYGWELSEFQDRKIDAQFSHTAGFEYTFHNDELILGFEVRNLTDEEITDVFNYPLMGRTYHLNLRYTWLR